MSRHRTHLALIAVVVTTLALHEAPAADTASVVVGQPQPAAPHTVELPAGFEPYEDALLHAKVSGYVSRVHVDIGDRVSAGTPLVELDIPEMEPTLGRARADLGAAEAALEKADAEVRRKGISYERLSDLQAQEPLAVTQQDVDMAAADLQVAEAATRSASAKIAVARARLEELEALMDYAVIRAPFDAVVARRLVDPGALVVSGIDGGGPVLEVVREDRLRLVIAVPEPIVSQTRTGIPAQITIDAMPDRTFEGVVSRCGVTLSQDTRTMRAEIDMGDHGGVLRPGMYGTVRLGLGGNSDELTVPASSVRHDGNGHSFVWTVRDGEAAKAAVEIARDDGAAAVIRAGLQRDTIVVLQGSGELQEGQAVRVADMTDQHP